MPYLKLVPALWKSGKWFLSCWCNALPRKAMGSTASADLIWSRPHWDLKLAFKKLFSKAFLWNSGQAVLMMISNDIFFPMFCSLRTFQHSSLLGCPWQWAVWACPCATTAESAQGGLWGHFLTVWLQFTQVLNYLLLKSNWFKHPTIL